MRLLWMRLAPVVVVLALTGCSAGDPGSGPEESPATSELEQDLNGAVGSIENYWATFFASQGGQFQPVEAVIPYAGPDDGTCGGEPFAQNNAFFCPSENFIAYDANFIKEQYESIGDAFVFYVIGHEYAHAVQDSLGISHRLTIEHELQADCLAGAYLGDSVRENKLTLEDGDLDELLNSLEAVGDQPGIPWFAEGAHGTGRQRTEAFTTGSAGTADGSSSVGNCL
ncbi:neutral zinc metallopeptidase [Kineosporia mesophila]|nr:neutral zinc metallopeptidase [Kineosporia mesophila]MCD5354275.1 neutral zinc metallopeptidase [Kineosporia mesophila]